MKRPASEFREALRMAAPLTLLNFSLALRTFFDMYFISRVGAAETRALLPAAECQIALIALPFGAINSWKAFVAQSHGRGKPSDCAAYAWQSLWFALAAGAVMTALAPLSPLIFSLTGHSPEVQRAEAVYFAWMLAGTVPSLLTWSLANFFIGVGDSLTPMAVGLAGNLFNIAACRVLTLGAGPVPAYGIAGAAWAVGLNYVFCLALLLVPFLGRGARAEFGTGREWRFRPDLLRLMLRVGAPRGLRKSLELFCFALFTIAVGRMGEDQLAGNNIAVRVYHLAILPAYGFGLAATALTGRRIGEGDFPRAEAGARWSLAMALGWTGTLSVLYLAAPSLFCGLFGADERSLDWTRRILVFLAFFQLLETINIVLAGAMEGGGDTRWIMGVQTACMWTLFLGLGLTLAFRGGMGVQGAWMGGLAYSASVCAAFLWRFRSGAWRKIDIFRREPGSPGGAGT